MLPQLRAIHNRRMLFRDDTKNNDPNNHPPIINPTLQRLLQRQRYYQRSHSRASSSTCSSNSRIVRLSVLILLIVVFTSLVGINELNNFILHQIPIFQTTTTTNATSNNATTIIPKTTKSQPSEFSDFLQNYVAFHKNAIQYNARGKSSLRPSTPFLVYTCRKRSTCGGLGDRIHGIVTAFYIAMCNQRIFLIEEEEQPPYRDFLVPNQILYAMDRPAPPVQVYIDTIDQKHHPVLLEPSILSRQPPYVNATGIAMKANLWIGSCSNSSSSSGIDGINHLRQSLHMQPTNDTTTTTTTTDHHHHHHHNDNNNTPIISIHNNNVLDPLYYWGFHTLFRFSNRVIQRANRMRQSVLLNMPYVAMHIRTGIIPGDVLVRHNDKQEWKQFITCGHIVQHALAIKCGGEVDDENHTAHPRRYDLYLAADHDNVKKYAISIDDSIKTIHHLNIFHHDKQDHIRKRQSSPPQQQNDGDDNNDGEWAVFSELYILHQATCLITSRSKYSDLAARLQETHCSIPFDECHRDSSQITSHIESLDAQVLCHRQTRK